MEDLSEELRNNLKSGAAVNISGYLRDLEKLSLTSNISTNSLILQFFAYYITDQLPHARLLWKRSPTSIKTTHELEKAWRIGKDLLKREYSAALQLLNSFHWIVAVDVVPMLRSKLLEDTRKRVAKSYISIEVARLTALLCCSIEETLYIAARWQWRIEDNYVFPVQVERESSKEVDESDILLITRLVGYLEQKQHIGVN